MTAIEKLKLERNWHTVYEIRDDMEEFNRVGYSKWYSSQLEIKVAQLADKVVTVSPRLAQKIKIMASLNIRSNKNLKYIVENIKTGEKTECAGLIGVSSLIGITYDNISSYISKGAVYKKTYKIYRVGEASKISNIRAVKITNVKTNEVKEFESLKSAAKFINIAPSSVTYNMKRNQPARGWKVEFID